jgi:hypothetical protein
VFLQIEEFPLYASPPARPRSKADDDETGTNLAADLFQRAHLAGNAKLQVSQSRKIPFLPTGKTHDKITITNKEKLDCRVNSLRSHSRSRETFCEANEIARAVRGDLNEIG